MLQPMSSFPILLAVVVVAAQTGPEIASYLRQHLTTTSDVHLPSESNYTSETTQRWNALSAPTYVVSVKPATEFDVQKIVRLINSSTKLFLVNCRSL